jgi:hypothetical protein
VKRLRWTPPTGGTHLLVLRAVDGQGRVAHAAPVRVHVAQPTREPAGGPSGQASPTATSGPAGHASQTGQQGPANGPALTVRVDGCLARIAAESGPALPNVAVYLLGPGQGGFQLLREGADRRSEATVPLVSGQFAVYALGYRDGRSAASPIVSITAPPECASRRWRGDASIVDGALVAPGEAQLAYLYLSINGGQWQRVPAADQTFVHRRSGKLDFSRVLPSLDGASRIDLEAWTRDRTDGVRRLGSGSLTAAPNEYLPNLVGLLPGTDLDLVVRTPLVDSQAVAETLVRHGEIHAYTEKSAPNPSQSTKINSTALANQRKFAFRWQPKVPGVTHGVWQVSMAPLGSSPVISGPGILAYGTVPVAQKDFEIDFEPLVMDGRTAAKTSQHVDYDTIVPQNYIRAKPLAGTAQPDTGVIQKAHTGEAVAIAPPAMTTSQLVRLVEPPSLYVRIVPMAGEQPVDAVSNLVTFDLYLTDPTPPTLKKPPSIDVQIQFRRPNLPNPAFRDCVRVVDNPFAGGGNPPQIELAPGTYVTLTFHADKFKPAPVGATVCPEYPSGDDDGSDLGDFLSDTLEVLTDFWDTLVAAYDFLKTAVVEFIAKHSGCTALLSEAQCMTVVGIAVDATLMFFGIPPSLPDSKALYALAKGELVNVLYAYAEQHNISCGAAEEQCKQMLADVLDEVLGEVEAEVSKAAKSGSAANGGFLWLHPDIKVVPEPKGTLQPAIFTITYTRLSSADADLPTDLLPTGCVYGRRPNWQWYDYDTKQHRTGAVEGAPLYANAKAIPVNLKTLAPGQSVTRIVVLGRPAVWFEPGADPVVDAAGPNQYLVHSDPSHYWVLMRGGAELTASLSCAGTAVDAWTTSATGWPA